MKKIGFAIALLSVVFTACYTAKSNTASMQSNQLVNNQTEAVTDKPQRSTEAAQNQPQQAHMIQTNGKVTMKKTGGRNISEVFEAAVGRPDSL